MFSQTTISSPKPSRRTQPAKFTSIRMCRRRFLADLEGTEASAGGGSAITGTALTADGTSGSLLALLFRGLISCSACSRGEGRRGPHRRPIQKNCSRSVHGGRSYYTAAPCYGGRFLRPLRM